MGDAGVLALGSVRSAWAVGLGASVALLSVGSSCSSRSGGDEPLLERSPPNGGSAGVRSGAAELGSTPPPPPLSWSRWRREKRGGHGLDRRQADRSRQHRRSGFVSGAGGAGGASGAGGAGSLRRAGAAGARRAGLRPGARERISGRAVQWQRRRLRRQRRRGLRASPALSSRAPRGPGTAPRGSVRTASRCA